MDLTLTLTLTLTSGRRVRKTTRGPCFPFFLILSTTRGLTRGTGPRVVELGHAWLSFNAGPRVA